MNTGVGGWLSDLGWKLAAIAQGSWPGLGRRKEIERRPVAARNQTHPAATCRCECRLLKPTEARWR